MNSVNPGLVTLQLLHTTDALHRDTWLHNLFYFSQQADGFTVYSFDATLYGAHSDEYTEFLRTLEEENFITIEHIPLQPIFYGRVQIGSEKTLPQYSITDKGEKVVQHAREHRELPLSTYTRKQISQYTSRNLNEFLRVMADKHPECFIESSRY